MAFRSFAKEGRKKGQHRKSCQEMVGLCVFRGFSCGNNKWAPDSGFVEHRGGYFIRFEQFSSPKGGDLTEKKKKLKNSIAAPSCPPEADDWQKSPASLCRSASLILT